MKSHPLNQVNELLGVTVFHRRAFEKHMKFQTLCGEFCVAVKTTTAQSKVTCPLCIQVMLKAIEKELCNPDMLGSVKEIHLLDLRFRLEVNLR